MRQMVAWNIYLHENNKISMPLHVGKYASHTWSMWDMFVFLLFLYTLLGKSQIAGWKMLDPDWLSRCNFPIEHGKIAAIAMLVYHGVHVLSKENVILSNLRSYDHTEFIVFSTYHIRMIGYFYDFGFSQEKHFERAVCFWGCTPI